jgi:S1-C subfamily serine protease
MTGAPTAWSGCARLIRLLLLCLAVWSPAARADDIAATARSVVRVVTIATVEGQVIGFGHGSGVAVAPNRIVTNAHVVELAARYPDDVLIGVVPSEGARSWRGRLIAYDAERDLALIEFGGARLPPAALFTGPMTDGEALVALGYPGNVDLATARSAADYISPVAPVRSAGVFSGRRRLAGTEVLLHTAGIARGNSGGPLLDRCGRVVGVNSAITRNEAGDAGFGFAIAASEVLAFLREAGERALTSGLPCTSMEERLRADAQADAETAAEAAAARRDAATAASLRREQALIAAGEAAARTRENVMGLAALLLVLGALAVGGAGFLHLLGRREERWWALAGGVAGMAAGVLVFVNRPGATPPPPDIAEAAPAEAPAPAGRLACAFDPARSRVLVSAAADVRLDWKGRACTAEGGWAEVDGRWQRIALGEGGVVSIRRYDPLARRLDDTRWLLSAGDAARVRRLAPPAACGTDPARLAEAQAAIRATLPGLPNEKLSYACTPAN